MELGYNILFFSTAGYRNSQNDYDKHEQTMFEFAPIEALDGIILAPDTYQIKEFSDLMFEALKSRAACPIVTVRSIVSGYDSVYTEENSAIRKVLRHIIEDHGITDVAFLAGYEGHPDGEVRLKCYYDEMEKHGLPLPEHAVFRGDMWKAKAGEAFDYFFRQGAKPPKAIVCANDYMAVSLCSVIAQNGLSVPQDVLVTGFDNVDGAGETTPTMTTIGRNYSDMAKEAVRLIHRRITEKENGVHTEGNISIGIPTELILRESCGCLSNDLGHYRMSNSLKYEQIVQFIQNQDALTYFSIAASECGRFVDLHDILMGYISVIPSTFRDIYVCLFTEKPYADDAPLTLNELSPAITDDVCLFIGYKDKCDMGLQSVRFKRCHLLPEICDRDEPQTFYFSLLHHGARCFGYTAIQHMPNETLSAFYLHWNVTISNILQSMMSKNALERLSHENYIKSITDPLTGLLNRRGFYEKMNTIWEEKCRSNEQVAFIGIDLDGLKYINDTFGHNEGDKSIHVVSESMIKAAPDDAVMVRTGGDEFIVFLPNASAKNAHEYIRAIKTELRRINDLLKRAYLICISAGAYITTLSEDSNIDECTKQCDIQMYIEKRKRKLDHHTGEEIT